MAGETQTGIVKSFNQNKGWGFIDCPGLGADAFVLKSELNGFAVAKGDEVTFTASTGPKGLQATNVSVTKADHDRFFGEIKTWNMAKGYGFIFSAATQQLFGKDVFCLQGELKNGFGAVGTQVMFKAKNSERGPTATDVQLIGADSWAPQLPMAAQGHWGGKGGWEAMQSMAPAAWGASWQKTPSEDDIYFGTIKAVNEEKGWGHISCDSAYKLIGKDLFVMKTSLEEANVHIGESVSFTIAQGPKGPHATNIRAFDAQGAGMVFSGSVKTFNDTKGWGFIDSEEAKTVFRTDIFVHKSELHGVNLATGAKVQFTVDISTGRASAGNIAVQN